MDKTVSLPFTYVPPSVRLVLDVPTLRATLEKVRDMLLSHQINGGARKFDMEHITCNITDEYGNKCGTAACIGGWAGILLAGYEGAASAVMAQLVALDRQMRGFDPVSAGAQTRKDRLYALFYGFNDTKDYNHPNVAATAIQRYLDNKPPWPAGVMPNKLKYKRG